MNIQIVNTGYEVLISAASASVLAQALKFLIFTMKNRKINFKIFTTTGGMPSAHSAFVTALSTTVGIINGFDSTVFAVAFAFALVIMYDAAGLRRAAGKTAASLNRIMEDFYKHNVEAIGPKLKELLGHTPVEVLVGAVFGVVIAYWLHLVVLG
jgi:acid phosphatase family membrane protein YuiD